jgi:hypothetical protein
MARGGAVVNGLTLVRDAEIHLPVVVAPAAEPVFGSLSGTESHPPSNHIFWNATWQLYKGLPMEIRCNSRTAARCHTGYQEGLQGRPVTETLLEAFCLFRKLDPSIVAHNDEGEIDGFPLPPAHGMLYTYYRLHPNEPSQDDVSRRLQRMAMEKNPRGRWREIHFAFRTTDSGSVLRFAGYEHSPNAIAGERRGVRSWVDYPDLVLRDVQRGYKYWLLVEGARHRVTLDHDSLLAAGAELSMFPIPNPPKRPDWWQIGLAASMDVFAHSQRRGISWYDVVAKRELCIERQYPESPMPFN